MCSTVFAQLNPFGGGGGFGGGFGGLTDVATNIASNIASRVPSVPILSDVKDFADFAAQSGKQYATAAERQLREGLFNAQKSLVDANNAAFAAGTSTYESALNAFADITNLEFLNNFTGNKKNSAGSASANEVRQESEVIADAGLPDSFDWHEKGGVTPATPQGECGSCWAFAVAGAIEGHIFRQTGALPSLSVQNLVDCGPEDIGLKGCEGGYQEYGFNFVVKQNGISNSDAYTYSGKQGTCAYNNAHSAGEIKGFAVINPNDEQTMKAVIAEKGPLACSVAAVPSMLSYKRGIFQDEACNTDEINHAILVVGYGTENGIDYWKVKNSWDKSWGEEGFFRIPRGNNYCHIAEECSYPVF